MAILNFKGKAFVQNYHLQVKYHQLIPRKNKSLTKKVSLHDNLIIHGDNLKALKSLLPTYAGKIKCIYIDPPYNTGNENWAYNDKVNSPMMQEWLGKVVDKEDLTRHDKWLCMMITRLKLLRELLAEDGAIFLSIDNNEVHSLRWLLNEVFGEENYISCIANVNNPKGRSDDKHIPTAHEYLLVYGKNNKPTLYGWKPSHKVLKRYNKTDENGKSYREIDLRKTGDNDRRKDRPNLFYYFLYNQDSKEFYATLEEKAPKGYIQIRPTREDGSDGNWRWELDAANEKIDRLFPKMMPVRKKWSVFEIDYLELGEKIKPTSAWTKKDFNSERGTEQFLELGFTKEDFSRPKPVGLLKHIFEFATGKNDIILDSFAGSGTTAQAVLALNKEDGGNRQFILVECEDYADEITAERIRRVIKGVQKAKDENLKKGLGGTFSYFDLGPPIEMEAILSGDNFPSYANLARYVFYTATGEEFDPDAINEKKNFIGESEQYLVYLFYKPDIEYLKATALTLDKAKALGKYKKKRRLVFAPTKYLDQEHLDELRIDFAQLPFEIYQLVK